MFISMSIILLNYSVITALSLQLIEPLDPPLSPPSLAVSCTSWIRNLTKYSPTRIADLPLLYTLSLLVITYDYTSEYSKHESHQHIALTVLRSTILHPVTNGYVLVVIAILLLLVVNTVTPVNVAFTWWTVVSFHENTCTYVLLPMLAVKVASDE